MAEASQNKEFLHSDWSPGYIVQRGTATRPNSLLVLENAQVEPDNSIRGRSGNDHINLEPFDDGSGEDNANDVHSHRLFGTRRYIGVGGIVCRVVDAGNGFVNQGPTIIDGLDGKRLTMATMAPSPGTSARWTYFANGNFTTHGAATGDPRKKDNYGETKNWGIDGPTDVVTLALGNDQPDTTLVDAFDNAYTNQDGIGTEGAEADAYDGGARKFTVPAGTTGRTERYQRAVTVDMSPYGEEGFVRIMFKVKERIHLDHLELAFDVGGGDFTDNYFHAFIAADTFTNDNIWQEIKVRKADFSRVKPTGGSLASWESVVAIQITVASADGDIDCVVSADDLRIEDDTHPDGVFDYRLTWWNDNEKIRSNPRALADIYSLTTRTSATIEAHRQRITVNRAAVTTADTQVTHWELWRRNRNGDGEFHYVDRIAIGTTVYNDDFTDLELGGLLVEDNHIPPPGRWIIPFDDRMFIMGMSSDDDLGTGEEQCNFAVRYSPRFRPESFPFSNYFLVGDADDFVRGCCVWQNQLWVWTHKTIYRVTPIDDSYVAQPTEAPVGTESPYAISPSPLGIFYYAPEDGPYLFDGSTSVSISSEQLDPFFRREHVDQDGIHIFPVAMNTVFEFENVVAAYYNRFYFLTVDCEDGLCVTLRYDTVHRRWDRRTGDGWNLRRMQWEKSGDNFSSADNLEGGTADGWLLLLEPIPERPRDFRDKPVRCIIQQTFDVALKPGDVEVDIKDIVVDADLGGQIVMVQASFDDGPLEVIGAQSNGRRAKMYFPVSDFRLERPEIGRICYKVSVRITIEQGTYRPNVFGIGVRYWPEPRRSTTYSAQWFAPVEQGWMRRGRFILRSYAPVVMVVYGDGRELYRTTLASTQGVRLGVNPSVPTGVRGKVIHVLWESDEGCVLYPQSYFEMYAFGLPAQQLQWQVTP